MLVQPIQSTECHCWLVMILGTVTAFGGTGGLKYANKQSKMERVVAELELILITRL